MFHHRPKVLDKLEKGLFPLDPFPQLLEFPVTNEWPVSNYGSGSLASYLMAKHPLLI